MTPTPAPRRSPMMTVVAAVAFAMVLFLVNRVGEPQAPAAVPVPPAAPVSYEGTTADGRIAVAVTVDGDRAVGHVAGRSVPLVPFLEGPVRDGAVSLGPRDGVSVAATVEGDRLTGTVRTGSGPDRPFTAVAGGAPR